MKSILIWRPEPLNARLVAAARPSAAEFAKAAGARAPAPRLASSVRSFGTGEHFLVGTVDPLGGYFEYGVKPHEIAPSKKKALKLADGSFVSTVQHPGMKAQPWLRPTLPLWPSLYRRNAALALRGL